MLYAIAMEQIIIQRLEEDRQPEKNGYSKDFRILFDILNAD